MTGETSDSVIVRRLIEKITAKGQRARPGRAGLWPHRTITAIRRCRNTSDRCGASSTPYTLTHTHTHTHTVRAKNMRGGEDMPKTKRRRRLVLWSSRKWPRSNDHVDNAEQVKTNAAVLPFFSGNLSRINARAPTISSLISTSQACLDPSKSRLRFNKKSFQQPHWWARWASYGKNTSPKDRLIRKKEV